MTAQMASVSISSPSPPPGHDSGIFSRFLRRATSTKGSTRSRRRRPAKKEQDNLSDQNLTGPIEGALLGVGDDPAPQQQLSGLSPQTASDVLPQTGSSITTTEPQLHEQRLPRSQGTTPEMLTEMAQPRLRKKTSIRDRLKSWQKPGQSPAPTTATRTAAPFNDQPKRFVYQPKHAAADFSRLAISTVAAPASRRNAKLSFDEDSTLSPSVEQVDARHAMAVLDEEADLVKSPPLQTLVENEMVAGGHTQTPHGKQRDESAKGDARDFTLQRSRSGARRSYKMVDDPWMASQAAARVPIGTMAARSLSSRNRTRESPLPADDMGTPLMDEQEKSGAKDAPSDFERFLAQAEAEDRAQREQIQRSFSHRSAFQPQSANYVKPNPHRQFVTVGGGNMSGTTAGPGLVSTGGSRSSRGGSQRTSGQYALSGREEQPFRPGHRKQASWTPSFGAGSNDVEKSLEKKSMDTGASSTWGPPQISASRSRRPQPPQPQTVVYSVDESFNQPEPQRTLRRKASITQRIADYIKPERQRPAAGGSEQGLQGLYRSASKSGLRTSGSRRRPRAIETLVE